MPTHEQLDREHEVATSSDRAFGLVFAAVFALVGVLRTWWSHADGPWWFAGCAAFAALALFWTAPLAPLNRLWSRLGMLLHAVVNPLLMGLIFLVSIVPIGLLMRLAGKDPLRLRLDRAAGTYWIPCEPPERRGAMKDQF